MKTQAILVLATLIILSLGAFAATDYAMATETTTNQTGDTNTTTTTTTSPGTTTTATTETIMQTTTTGTLSEADVSEILQAAGLSTEEIAQAAELLATTEITQEIKVEKITSASGDVSYKTTVVSTVKNSSNKDWKNVKVVIEVPKAVTTNATNITSPLSFSVLKADPIIQFVLDIPSGTSKTVTWSVAGNTSKTVADTIKKPIIISFTEETPATNKCAGISCDDSNPCTIDSCDATTGNCKHINAADNTVCGTGMVCKTGNCTATTTGQVTTPGKTGELPIVPIVIVIIVIIGIAYYFVAVKK
jgi:hypothetical protein